MDRVVVFNSLNLAEADLVHSHLKSAGLQASMEHADSATAIGWTLATGGVSVTVPEDQAGEARALIESGNAQGL